MITLNTQKKESLSIHQKDIDVFEVEVRGLNGAGKVELTEKQINDLAKKIAQYNDLDF